jgi:DNA-binding transcriptional regulator PaaX
MWKNSKTKELFEEICSMFGSIEKIFAWDRWKYNPLYGDIAGWEADAKRHEEWYWRKRAFKRLEEQKLIRVTKKGDEVYVALTEKGALTYLKSAIKNSKRTLPRRERCLIVFDVPEKVCHARNALRYFLRDCQFQMIQRSVWMTDKDVRKEVKILLNNLKTEEWVRVFIAEEL